MVTGTLLVLLVSACSPTKQESSVGYHDTNNGRYQLITGNAVGPHGETIPVVLKIDTATGATWRYQPDGSLSKWLPTSSN
jgi:hypothetical protein